MKNPSPQLKNADMVSNELKDLIYACTVKDQKKRCSAEWLSQSSLFNNVASDEEIGRLVKLQMI